MIVPSVRLTVLPPLMKSTAVLSRSRVLVAVALMLTLSLAACGTEQESREAMPYDQAAQAQDTTADMVQDETEAVRATVEDAAVQTIEVEATDGGFQPQHVIVQEGMPTVFVVTRRTSSRCLEQIAIPAFGIEATDLPLNEPVSFQFTPERTGTFEFICGMDMQHGTIVVEA